MRNVLLAYVPIKCGVTSCKFQCVVKTRNAARDRAVALDALYNSCYVILFNAESTTVLLLCGRQKVVKQRRRAPRHLPLVRRQPNRLLRSPR